MMEYTRGTQEDIEELTQRRLDYLRCDLGEIPAEKEEILSQKLPQYFREHLDKDLFAFTAKDNGKIVGNALLLIITKPSNPTFLNGRIGRVMGVYTVPEYRRKGIASTLMKNLLAFAKTQEVDFVELSATEEGYPVYKNLGFTEHPSPYVDMRYNF